MNGLGGKARLSERSIVDLERRQVVDSFPAIIAWPPAE